MTTEYSLRIFDEELLRFSLKVDEKKKLSTTIHYINEEQKNVLPFPLQRSVDFLDSWLQSRVVPRGRAYSEKLFAAVDLDREDMEAVIRSTRLLSLTDSYWVVPTDFKGTWAEHNLYQNDFDERLEPVALAGASATCPDFMCSPEFTTNGMLPKAWHRDADGNIYLYKAGTEGAYNAGNEPYAEYYASQVAEAMGLNHVHYDLEPWQGKLAAKCRLFTDEETAFIPVAAANRILLTVADVLNYCKALGEEAYEEMKSLLVFDAVIYNEDRHFGNYGFIRDSETGKILAPAPIFDNGMSLFAYAGKQDLPDLTDYAADRRPSYQNGFADTCRELIGPVQRQQLERLRDFHFTRHPQYNWPETRLQETERQLHLRVQQMLGTEKWVEADVNEARLLRRLSSTLRNSIDAMEQCWARLDRGEADSLWDCYWRELQADIATEEVSWRITEKEAWYLREKYLRLSPPDEILITKEREQ